MSNSQQIDFQSDEGKRGLVSVVIAAYNAADFIGDAIESVLDQTYSNLELHIIDDGSTDDTKNIVNKWAGDPRLNYYFQKNSGQTVAKNNGISKCTGEFIAFCDADDFWALNKLEIQIPYFDEKEQLGVVYSNSTRINEKGEPIGQSAREFHNGRITEKLFVTNFIPFGTAVIRRRHLEIAGVFNEKYSMGIDWELWLRLSLSCEFQYANAVTSFYRVWPGQMSSSWRGRYKYCFMIMEDFIRQNPGVLGRSIIKEAYANSYTNRANYRFATESDFTGALGDIFRAVRSKLSYAPAWKELAKLIVKRLAKLVSPKSHLEIDSDTNMVGKTRNFMRKSRDWFFISLTRQVPRILMYHRFSERRDHRAVSIDAFARQMKHISKNFEVVTLHQAMTEYSRGSKLSKPQVVVTVDDGYKDFISVAMPVLGDLNLPATVFVTTGVVSGEQWMWPDALEYVLIKAESGEYALTSDERRLTIGIDGSHSRQDAWDFLADFLVFRSNKVRFDLISQLAVQAKCQIPGVPTSKYEPMTWADLTTIKDAGIEIGAHTVSHEFLPSQNIENRNKELVGAKEQLERKLDIRVRSFAYPHGTAKDHSPEIVSDIKKAGYLWAVVAYPRALDRQSPFEIGRWSVGRSKTEFNKIVTGACILMERVKFWSKPQ